MRRQRRRVQCRTGSGRLSLEHVDGTEYAEDAGKSRGEPGRENTYETVMRVLWHGAPKRLITLSVFIATTALAPGAKAADSDATVREAATHFQRGVGLYREADYRGALVEFHRAGELVPAPVTFYNIGETEYQLREYAEALTALSAISRSPRRTSTTAPRSRPASPSCARGSVSCSSRRSRRRRASRSTTIPWARRPSRSPCGSPSAITGSSRRCRGGPRSSATSTWRPRTTYPCSCRFRRRIRRLRRPRRPRSWRRRPSTVRRAGSRLCAWLAGSRRARSPRAGRRARFSRARQRAICKKPARSIRSAGRRWITTAR